MLTCKMLMSDSATQRAVAKHGPAGSCDRVMVVLDAERGPVEEPALQKEEYSGDGGDKELEHGAARATARESEAAARRERRRWASSWQGLASLPRSERKRPLLDRHCRP